MRRRWMAGGLALLLGLLVWVLTLTSPDTREWVLGGGSSPPGSSPVAEAREPSTSAVAAGVAASAASVPLEAADLDPAAAAAAQRDAVGGCGQGRPTGPSWAAMAQTVVAAVRGPAEDAEALARRQAEEAAEQAGLRPRERALVDRLAQGGPLAKAAALLLRDNLDEQGLSEASHGDGTTAAPPAAASERGQALSSSLQALARDSGSLPVLRLALGTCYRRGQDAQCLAPWLDTWRQREPDNAAPWLLLAGLAEQRGDPQAMEDAMYRAASATRLDSHVLPMLAALSEPAFDAAGGAAAAALQIRWLGIVMAQPWGEFSRISRYCERRRLGDANLAQRCDALARLLVERDGSLLGLSIGRGVGERLGWPAERLAQLDDRRFAVAERSSGATFLGDPMDCRTHAALRQEMLGVARRGEIGHHLARMAAEGTSEATLAAAARVRQAAAMAAARESAAQQARSGSAPQPTP